MAMLWTAAAAAQSEGGPVTPRNPYVPPPCTGTVFVDVDCSTGFDAWIEQYSKDGITAGCTPTTYCPNDPVSRAQMAVFVEEAMRGTLTWSPGDLGNDNTGLGFEAMLDNTTAGRNTAIGRGALHFQSFDNGGVEGVSANTAVGAYALYQNTPTSTTNGVNNTAVGDVALYSNDAGSSNTAIGSGALYQNEGSDNTAVGSAALDTNLDGFSNTAVGSRAGNRGGEMVTGYSGAPVTFVNTFHGSYNTFLGINGATADINNCTAVGMDAYCDATDQVRLGNFFVNSIGGKVAWSALSDARAKLDVDDLPHGLPLVLGLRPVTFRYKGGNGRTDMGFVAQEVERLLGDGYNVVDAGGDAQRTLSLRYTELIAPLVKAVQEQQTQIEALRAELVALRSEHSASQAK